MIGNPGLGRGSRAPKRGEPRSDELEDGDRGQELSSNEHGDQPGQFGDRSSTRPVGSSVSRDAQVHQSGSDGFLYPRGRLASGSHTTEPAPSRSRLDVLRPSRVQSAHRRGGTRWHCARHPRRAFVRVPAGSKPNLLPNHQLRNLDETVRMLDEKLFSVVDDEIPAIKDDTALGR